MDFSSLMTSLPELTAGNMLAGGVFLGALTYVWSKIQSVLSPVLGYYISKYTTFIELKDNHPTYYFAAVALASKLPVKRGRFKVEGTGSTVYGIENGDDNKSWFLLPGYGLHILRLQGFLCFVRFIRRDLHQKEEGKSYEETITLWFPFGHSGIIASIIEEGREIFNERQRNSNKVRRYVTKYDYWDHAGEIKFKNIDNIILPEEDKNNILHSIEDFRSEKEWFIDHNIPYKTGFLFYGPPGTGKTSMISALAYKFKMPVYSLALSGAGCTDEQLISLVRQVPEQSILVFEDIDKINISNKNAKKETLSKITLSGLLNALDGLNSGEGFITIMTANNPEKIDDALLRPGRVDQKILFNLPTVENIAKFIEKFYGIACTDTLMDAAKIMFQEKWSMAAVQSYCLQFKKDVIGCLNIAHIHEFNDLLNTDFSTEEPIINEEAEEIEKDDIEDDWEDPRFVGRPVAARDLERVLRRIR